MEVGLKQLARNKIRFPLGFCCEYNLNDAARSAQTLPAERNPLARETGNSHHNKNSRKESHEKRRKDVKYRLKSQKA